MLPDTREFWQSPHLGRYHVHRLATKSASASPAKPARQRINVNRTIHPFLNGTGFAPPDAFIHKHSAAIAFSIIVRSYSLLPISAPGPGGTPLQSGSCNTHLPTREPIMLASKKVQQQYTSTNPSTKLTRDLLEVGSRNPGAGPDKSRSRGPLFLEKVMQWEKYEEIHDAEKANPKDKNKESASYSTESTITSTPDHSVEKLLDEDQVSCHRDSIDSDEHLLIPQKPSNCGSSFANRIFRRFRDVSSHPDSSRSLPAGALTDLHDSFRDLGLLHTQPHQSGLKGSLKKAGHHIFHFLPESLPYMLLPLWAAETPPSMNPSPDTQATKPEHRQYLLVWYVPFENTPDQQQQPNAKKKPKQNRSMSDATSPPYLSGFRVNARLLPYHDLHASGIHLPTHGLVTTVPACEPVYYHLEAAREVMQINDPVICVCTSREKGFQFQLQGLAELGLCSQEEVAPSPSLLPPLPPLALGPHQQREVKPFLTPLGRAVVEVVWLGCLAITSFGPA